MVNFCHIREEEGVILCVLKLGVEIEQAVKDALQLSRLYFKEVHFELNGITVQVEYYSIANAIVRDFHRALNGLIDDVVGPKCEYPLSDASIASDKEKLIARIQPERQHEILSE